MILVACATCPERIRVMGDPEELELLVGSQSEFWPDKYRCPACDAPARAVVEHVVEACGPFRELSPQEAFAAFHGLGLPDDLPCTIRGLEALLREKPLRRVVGRDLPGTTRCVVTQLELWDGTRVYLGAGAMGACVYRVAPPPAYAEKVHAGS